MKKSLLFCLFIFLFLPANVFANGAGLPAFFAINGKLATPNPLQLYGITSQSFLIPQDFAQENYIVNQPIGFTIDTKPLETVIQPYLLAKTTFVLDYGDGSEKVEGLESSHTYSKSGSYIITVTMNVYTDHGQPPTQFIDSFFINILPNKDYQSLPKAMIKVDNELVREPLKRPFERDFSQTIHFDSASSYSRGGEIISYLWNFGDGQTSTEKSPTHTYATNRYFNTVVLRVIDDHGFISDAFVGLKNSPDESKKHTPPAFQINSLHKSGFSPDLWIALFIIVMTGVLIFILRREKKQE